MSEAPVYAYTNSKGVVYYLHGKNVHLRGGVEQRIYYFARDVREGALSEIPEGYKVIETKRTAMPVLKEIEK